MATYQNKTYELIITLGNNYRDVGIDGGTKKIAPPDQRP